MEEMHEWVIVTLLGCLGGVIATPFPKGTDIPFDPVVAAVLSSNKWANLLVHAVLNLIAGGVASFVLWAGYTSSIDLQSMKVAPVEMGTSLTVGLGGVGIVRNLIAKAQSSSTWEDVAKSKANDLDKIVKSG